VSTRRRLTPVAISSDRSWMLCQSASATRHGEGKRVRSQIPSLVTIAQSASSAAKKITFLALPFRILNLLSGPAPAGLQGDAQLVRQPRHIDVVQEPGPGQRHWADRLYAARSRGEY